MSNIGHFNIPRFPIALEQALNPQIKGCPVVIALSSSDRSKIWCASKETWVFGIHKGQPLAQARALCKDLHVIHPNPDLYRRVNRKLVEEFKKRLPLFECEREGKFYFDYQGMEKLSGSMDNFSLKLKKDILKKYRLDPHIGLGENKLVSKTAGKLSDFYKVPRGDEEKFLSPLPGDVIPPVKEERGKQKGFISDIFQDLSLDLVEDLSPLGVRDLSLIFGQQADTVYEMVRGIDFRPVLPIGNAKTVLKDVILDFETNSLASLSRHLLKVLEDALKVIKEQDYYFRSLKFSLRFSDFKVREKVISLKTFSQGGEELETKLLECLKDFLKRRVKVRYLGVELLDLTREGIQLDLFENFQGNARVKVVSESVLIEEALEKINKKFKGKVNLGKRLLL